MWWMGGDGTVGTYTFLRRWVEGYHEFCHQILNPRLLFCYVTWWGLSIFQTFYLFIISGIIIFNFA